MTTEFLGTTFPPDYQWHVDEHEIINCLLSQIEKIWPDSINLLVNTTWFGPQFDNGLYEDFIARSEQSKIDNLFFLAAADPVFLNSPQLEQLVDISGCHTVRYLGHFDSPYRFNFHSLVLPKYFRTYERRDLILDQADWIFVNYNRKPREHRTALVKLLLNRRLTHHGIISLGENNDIYSKNTDGKISFLLGEKPEDFAKEGNWGMSMEFGIPHDIHSLGNMEIWQRHFLSIVGETEFYPWDNMFISEKTWKPILGLRPFVINGQQKIYGYLRDQGFKTFNHYWPDIDIEEGDVHTTIVELIDYLGGFSKDQLKQMYNQMLPELLHNQQRFFEYSAEQRAKVENLFCHG